MIESSFAPKIAQLSEMFDAFPFEDRDVAHVWLSQQYYIIENATRYEAIGASLLPMNARDEFRHRITHLTSEFDHDELIIQDLQKMGFDELYPIMPVTQALINSTYYELQKHGPDALFGISLLLEGLATKQCAKLWHRFDKAFGVQSYYLKIHDEADKEHYPESLELTEAYSEDRKRVILKNLEVSFFLYRTILNECRVAGTDRMKNKEAHAPKSKSYAAPAYSNV